MGFYGLWLPGNPTLTTGTAITKINMSTGAQEAGTLIVAPGRLEKQTTQDKTLGQLTGTRLLLRPTLQNNSSITNTIAKWDSTLQQFIKTGEETCSQQSGCINTPMTPTPISNADLLTNLVGNGFALEIQIDGVGGGGFTQLIMRDNNQQVLTPTNSSPLVIWTSELINPTIIDDVLTFYCYSNCPVFENTSFTFKYPAWDSSGGSNDYLTYTLNKNITASSNAYTMLDPNGVAYISSSQQSLWLGDLVTSPVSNIDDLYNGTAQIRYNWRSSSQAWDQFITFRADADNSISNFDAPLNLTYQDSDGLKFVQYEGFGQLHGIPGQCLSRLTGAVVNCGSDNEIWIPEFNIPSGTTLVSTANSNAQYFVRQLSIAQNLTPITETLAKQTCIDDLQTPLQNSQTLTLPSISNWVNPNLGGIPSVGNTPSVIDGVNQ